MKIPLDYTYVNYESDDIVGLCFAFVTLTPIYLMVMYTTLIVFRRDYSTCYALGGQLLNLIINKILKKIINQPRPESCEISSDSGMPSNHSQFMSYFILFYIVQITWVHSKYFNVGLKVFYISVLIVMGAAVCYSRYYLNYHTAEQVVVGACIGSIVGVVWSMADVLIGQPLGDFICQIPIIKFFAIINYSPLSEYYELRGITTKRTEKDSHDD